jgi:hypothetical protein
MLVVPRVGCGKKFSIMDQQSKKSKNITDCNFFVDYGSTKIMVPESIQPCPDKEPLRADTTRAINCSDEEILGRT